MSRAFLFLSFYGALSASSCRILLLTSTVTTLSLMKIYNALRVEGGIMITILIITAAVFAIYLYALVAFYYAFKNWMSA